MGLNPARRRLLARVFATLALATGPGVQAQGAYIVMASTTSTEQSGLFAHLLPP